MEKRTEAKGEEYPRLVFVLVFCTCTCTCVCMYTGYVNRIWSLYVMDVVVGDGWM